MMTSIWAVSKKPVWFAHESIVWPIGYISNFFLVLVSMFIAYHCFRIGHCSDAEQQVQLDAHDTRTATFIQDSCAAQSNSTKQMASQCFNVDVFSFYYFEVIGSSPMF